MKGTTSGKRSTSCAGRPAPRAETLRLLGHFAEFVRLVEKAAEHCGKKCQDVSGLEELDRNSRKCHAGSWVGTCSGPERPGWNASECPWQARMALPSVTKKASGPMSRWSPTTAPVRRKVATQVADPFQTTL